MARTYDENGCITSCKADMSLNLPAMCEAPATHHVEVISRTSARVRRGLTGQVHMQTRGGECKAHAEEIAAMINARASMTREEYVNSAPGYQSRGARLLRSIMFDNPNPPIVEQVSADTIRARDAQS